MASAFPFNNELLRFPIPELGYTTTHLLTNAAALRLGSFLRQRIRLQCASHQDHLLPLQHLWHDKVSKLTGFDILRLSYNTISSKFRSWSYIEQSEDINISNSGSDSKGPEKGLTYRGNWTNIIIATNVVVYLAQFATKGKLLDWGAKINSEIDKGEFWRLITSSFLHANMGHLLINCYSLNSIGPAVQNTSGSKRFLAVYMTSAVASSAVSYLMCKSSSVGASGAIFGLVGYTAMYYFRHMELCRNSEQYLQHTVRVVLLNLCVGMLSMGIDNWGHVGGLLGGTAASWLLGPAWKLETIGPEGREVLVDKAPIFTIMKIAKSIRYK